MGGVKWFPADGGTGETGHAWSVANAHDFALVDIVDLGLSVGTTDSHKFIIFADFGGKDFSMYIAEEIDDSGFAVLGIDELDLTWIEGFVDFHMLLMFEDVVETFGGDEFLEFWGFVLLHCFGTRVILNIW